MAGNGTFLLMTCAVPLERGFLTNAEHWPHSRFREGLTCGTPALLSRSP
jgi:hypothetical protein